MRRVYLILILCLCFFKPEAQEQNNFSFHHLTSSNGLTSNNTGKIIQDSRGFLWICTEDGLNMYDGQSMKQYYLSDYISSQANSNFISGIVEDADGNMLIAAKAGIIKFSWNTKQFSVAYKNPFTSFGNVNLDLFTDAAKNIWVNERVRIKKFDAHFHLLHTWNLRDSSNSKNLNAPSVTFICGEDSHHNIWFTDSNSVFKIDALNNKIDSSLNKKLKCINPAYTQCSFMCFTENSVWMIINSYMLLRFNSSFQLTDKFELSKEIVPFYIGIIEQNGKAWIATRFNGVLVLDIHSGKIQHYGENNSLSSDNINGIEKDASQNIWISTVDGINEWQANTSFFYRLVFNTADNSIAQKYSVQNIFFKNNMLYTFISDGIIQTQLIENQSKYFFDSGKNFPGGVYYSSAFPYKQKWLLSRHHSIEFLQFKNRLPVFSSINFPHPSKLDSSGIVSFYEDDDKNIWMGLTDDRGIICWHANNNSFSVYSQKDTGKNYCPLRHLSYAAEDGKGNIWMGYDKGGISIFDKKQNRFVGIPSQEKNSISNVSVLGMINDHHGNIWIATNTGLIQYNETKNNYRLITRKNGLPSNFVKSITADKAGNVWAGFEGALAKINTSSNSITTYNTTDGLPGEDLDNPLYDTASGTMFFCTSRSVIYFKPQEVKKIIPLLKPVVTSFEVMGNERPIIPGKKINIPYSQNYLSFSFSAPNFANASETEYACKLEDADKDWNYIGNHHLANYSQLQPGNYIFKVMARVKEGNWRQSATPIVISILAPFWQTAWFWITSIILL
ncbi:MAG TPA: two-component regulator propeller domain-containing protein, partial [Parafilimonas sp.]